MTDMRGSDGPHRKDGDGMRGATVQTGDLIFLPDDGKTFSDMISRSTAMSKDSVALNGKTAAATKTLGSRDPETSNGAPAPVRASLPTYTHVAMVERGDDGVHIMHATVKRGCIRQSLAEFIADRGADADVFRASRALRDPRSIVRRARAMLGAPYNPSFRIEQSGYYCSEFVFQAFANEHLFHLTPMTFGPDRSVLPQWVDYYRKLGLPIPNGEWGTSPNSLLAGQALRFIGALADLDRLG
jgi:hypothetical protein